MSKLRPDEPNGHQTRDDGRRAALRRPHPELVARLGVHVQLAQLLEGGHGCWRLCGWRVAAAVSQRQLAQECSDDTKCA